MGALEFALSLVSDLNYISCSQNSTFAFSLFITGLGAWVRTQRAQKKYFDDGKGTTMTDEKIDLLERLSFPWVLRSSSWETRFAELCQFQDEFGHLGVCVLILFGCSSYMSFCVLRCLSHA